MMLDGRNLVAPGKHMIEMRAPARWILAAALLAYGRVADDGSAEPACCFGFLLPDRLQHAKHERSCVDLADEEGVGGLCLSCERSHCTAWDCELVCLARFAPSASKLHRAGPALIQSA